MRAAIVELLGFVLVSVGAAMVYLPAGVIVGGLLLALFALALERGNE